MHTSHESTIKMLNNTRLAILTIFIFSIFVNLLILVGPLYMLQIYDRVLSSQSVETLVVLSGLVLGLYAIMGILDWARRIVIARVGAQIYSNLSHSIFNSEANRTKKTDHNSSTINNFHNLSLVQQAFISNAILGLFDILWVPIFAGTIFLFHPWLGWLALIGGLFLCILILCNQILGRKHIADTQLSQNDSTKLAHSTITEHETIAGLGMQHNIYKRWHNLSHIALTDILRVNDLSNYFGSFIRSFRLFLQSAILGLGAFLVLQQELSAGAMIAGSILLGRALAPIEQTITQLPTLSMAYAAWKDLHATQKDNNTQIMSLPAPIAKLEVENLTTAPHGQQIPTLRGVNFTLEPGEVIGIIGASASGKTSLARALLGLWPHLSGNVRLGGASINQYDRDTWARHIGYLPQNVTFFDASIAENIARMEENPDHNKVIKAAKIAGAHDIITAQNLGYNQSLATDSHCFSGGQLQRIALARALYDDPVLLILDEPNASLDAIGSHALNMAVHHIKSHECSAIIMAHRPSAIQICDRLMILENGFVKAQGPRDSILREHVQNANTIKASFTSDKSNQSYKIK